MLILSLVTSVLLLSGNWTSVVVVVASRGEYGLLILSLVTSVLLLSGNWTSVVMVVASRGEYGLLLLSLVTSVLLLSGNWTTVVVVISRSDYSLLSIATGFTAAGAAVARYTPRSKESRVPMVTMIVQLLVIVPRMM